MDSLCSRGTAPCRATAHIQRGKCHSGCDAAGRIGAGSICLNGYGGLQDFAIRTHPETTALPEGFSSGSPEAAFAVLHIKGNPGITKMIEGPFPPFKIFDQGLQGQGLRRGGFEGFPRFAKCTFQGGYPFGEAEFTDPSIPLQVTLLGWNPFIPLDDKNSGIPCVILEYSLRNTSSLPVEYEFSYHLSHLAAGCKQDMAASENAVIPGKGVFLHNTEEPNAESYGSATLTVIGETPRIKGMWLRSPVGSLIHFPRFGAKFQLGRSLPTTAQIMSTLPVAMEPQFCLRAGSLRVSLGRIRS